MLVLLAAWGCGDSGGSRPLGSNSPGAASPQREPSPGLVFRLSEGREEGAAASPAPTASATPLSVEETKRILQRLPPVHAETADRKPFALREKSLPAPRTGATIRTAFPPAAETAPPATPAAADLTVLRHAPDGDVSLAPFVSVTFSQPMVPLTAHADLAAQGVPVNLSPAPPGEWHWIGTRTLVFQPKGRFPMATEYAVEIPAGTASAAGSKLKSAVRWTFRTPPPSLAGSYPGGGPVVRDPLMFVAFDQKIDAPTILKALRITAWSGNTTPPDLRFATEDEVAADDSVRNMVAAQRRESSASTDVKAGGAAAYGERWLAFRATAPLPVDTSISVALPVGTPSAEGPRKTEAVQTFSFKTYGPMRLVVEDNRTAVPLSPWYLRFTNPIDAKAFKKSMVRVSPDLPGMKVRVSGESMYIQGRSQGRTTYSVRLDADLPDSFGQTLGEAVTASIKVGSASPTLSAPGDVMAVLDPASGGTFSVYCMNHEALRVRAYRVQPSDWDAFMKYLRAFNEDLKEKGSPPGKPVIATVIKVKGAADTLNETRIDLGPALKDGLGQVVLLVEPTVQPKNRWERQHMFRWIQSTRLGLDAFVDHGRLLGWATALKDGRPLSGVALTLAPTGAIGSTGGDGLATLPLPDKGGANVLVAKLGDDVAILPRDTSYWGGQNGWVRVVDADTPRWYVCDDRQMYRPAEQVHVKGWIRRMAAGPTGDLELLAGAREVHWTLDDSRGNHVLKGTRPVDALGGFDLATTLPKTMNLGPATLHFAAPGAGETTHGIQVQEFRRPEFEVSAATREGPSIVGGHATVSVTASYYAGGGLPNAKVDWNVVASPGYFTPPNRSDFTFGTWIPWWGPRASVDGGASTQSFSSRTEASGTHRLRIDFDAVRPARPMSVRAQASVMDVNRQQWSASTSVLVHPSALYVGLKSDTTFVQPGDPLQVQCIVTDLDGKAVPQRSVALRLARVEVNDEENDYVEKEVDVQQQTLTSADDAVAAKFATKEGGRYRLTARIQDDQGRPNETETTLWVAGGKPEPERGVSQQSVKLIPDRRTYKPGDTAQILVSPPFAPAEGVMTVRRAGIAATERFRVDQGSYTLKVPVTEAGIPSLDVQVDLVGATLRRDDHGKPDPMLPKRPAYVTGGISLSVPPLARKLQLTATPRDEALAPGGKTTLDVVLKDADGKPVSGGQVAVVVVDESVLALTGYRVPDPLNVFYTGVGGDVSEYHSRASVVLDELQVGPDDARLDERFGAPRGGAMPTLARAPMPSLQNAEKSKSDKDEREENAPAAKPVDATTSAGEPPATQIALRTNLNALAVFAPALPTDAEGHASVPVKLPDNLTRYRVMAVAVAGARQFGSGESTITARLPLMVRPSAPRFLNFGDRCELPVVLQNQTKEPMEVHVAIRATLPENRDRAPFSAEKGALSLFSGLGVTVPPNDRVEVRFPVATVSAGTARFQIAADSGATAADAAEISLPVWTPATTEAFATYGFLDGAVAFQPVLAPTDVFPQFGGIEVTTSSTQLQELTDAVLYLESYPFECSEQISSRVLAVAALKDVLAAFKAPGLPKPQAMLDAMKRDLERLHGMQGYDGRFGFWHPDEPHEWPYLGIHVAHALARAKQKGFVVPPDMLARSRQYLQSIEQHIPADYGIEAKRSLRAYALCVRNLLGDADPAKAHALFQEGTLQIESLGWILPSLAKFPADVQAIRKALENRVVETAADAHFTTAYGDGAYLMLSSDYRADAIILEALIATDPKSDLIAKLVRGLLDHRKRGRWDNTQENAFVLLALDRYFHVYEHATPDFVARVWLGDRFAGSHAFRGRTTERHEVDIPMAYVKGTQNLIVGKQGKGRLYYRLGMQYAPTDLKLPPADHGFTVQRVYEAVDHPDDVKRDADGVWHVKAGAAVRVRVTMVAPTRRYHVALVDPLPAGLEAMNPELAVTGPLPADPKASPWSWFDRWYEHENLRDERAEAFTPLLWEGVYRYGYVARATTPGRFVVPPPKAEEMYHPETFGRGAADVVIVE